MKASVLATVFATLVPFVALAQESTHYKTWPEALRQVEQSGTVPRGWQVTALSPQADPGLAPGRVEITMGAGGSIAEHAALFARYRIVGTKVQLRGPCYSACTIITSYVKKENLCIAEGAFMAFHAARSTMDGPIHVPATLAMYEAYPAEIRVWIMMNGGVDKLPRDGYWTMYDRELWAMGYPKCN